MRSLPTLSLVLMLGIGIGYAVLPRGRSHRGVPGDSLAALSAQLDALSRDVSALGLRPAPAPLDAAGLERAIHDAIAEDAAACRALQPPPDARATVAADSNGSTGVSDPIDAAEAPVDDAARAHQAALVDSAVHAIEVAIEDGAWTLQDRDSLRELVASGTHPDEVAPVVQELVRAVNAGRLDKNFDGPLI